MFNKLPPKDPKPAEPTASDKELADLKVKIKSLEDDIKTKDKLIDDLKKASEKK